MIEDLLLKTKEYSKCKKHHISAIIVNDNNSIIGIGYNTPIIGNQPCCRREGCTSGTCLNICNAVHAEVMAILDMGKKGDKGNTIYITDAPCINCARIIAASGIKKVIYYKDYYKKGSEEYLEVIKIFERYNVKFRKIKEEV